ncbi:MAG TPA: hypothetical protein DIT25_00935 [Candidatus Moranbacteria bacterium]|nr:hypothetical protein [Candidatus Moranbacteria bacterium]
MIKWFLWYLACIAAAVWYVRRSHKKWKMEMKKHEDLNDRIRLSQEKLGAYDEGTWEYECLLGKEVAAYYEWLNSHPYCGGRDYFHEILAKFDKIKIKKEAV